jgi:peptidoglycan-associated lipoprotein
MNSRNAWSAAAVVGTLALTLGCAPQQREVVTARTETTPQASAPAVGTTSTSITTTTSAPIAVTPGIGMSEELIKACNIHFSNVDQAPKFDFDRAELTSDDRAVLDQVAQCVTSGPLKGRSLHMVGRADPRGEVEYNMALGEHRASSVEGYLKQLGVDGSRMDLTSRGKLDATGTDETTWARDRRVDIDLR